MKFYSFEDIRAAADCAAFAKDVFGCRIAGGRCAAIWRGGDNPEAVAIDREKWYDHVEKTGGGIIELAAIRFDGNTQQAQAFLGEYYGLQPRMETGPQPAKDSRYDQLIRQGYKEVARYGYHDLDGNLVHFASRLEHPEKQKEFLQGTPAGWGLKNVATILYNLQGITDLPWCCIVEGEKTADALIAEGIPATTCCGGAKKWHSGYAETFKGKHVAVLPDNDDPGYEHANIIAASLVGIAAEVRIVPTSEAPKGDAYNYLIDEGHSADELIQLIGEAACIGVEIMDEVVVPEPESPEIRAAKMANQVPFRNFIPIKHQDDAKQKRRNAKPEIERKPRLISEMIDDCHHRFLGFPRKVGEQLFDHDRDSGRICYLYKSSELFAWIGRKSKQRTEWTRGDACVTKDEIFAGLAAAAIRYEAISLVPDWPKRCDVYYAHKRLPPACPDRSRFTALLDSFAPATAADRTMLKAFLIAPLWYIYGIPKPSWIIDSEDGAGTGKSTLAEIAAHLYCGEPIRTNRQELRMGVQELIKRVVSSHGRQQRILLVDNVTGQFSCPELADLITAQSISGRAPYGHGEETRPNNLVFVITSNTANVDNDIADRSYYINVRRPSRSPDWKPAIMAYVDKHRFEIVADIIAMLEAGAGFQADPHTRFPEFETSILQAVCDDLNEYEEAINHLKTCKSDTSVEEEQAKVIEDAIRERLAEIGLHPDQHTVFIRTPVLEHWLDQVLDRYSYQGGLIQHVRNLAKMRQLEKVDPKIRRFPFHGEGRRSGIMWNWGEVENPKTLALTSKKEVQVLL